MTRHTTVHTYRCPAPRRMGALGLTGLFFGVLAAAVGGFALLTLLRPQVLEQPRRLALALQSGLSRAGAGVQAAVEDAGGRLQLAAQAPSEAPAAEQPLPAGQETAPDQAAETEQADQTGQAAAPSGTVELQLQNPELPNGCEATSLAMLLTAAGCPADKLDLAECLPRQDFWVDGSGVRNGPDPAEAYAGDPASASGGWYCLEAPAAQAGNTWARWVGSSVQVTAVSGLSRAELEQYLQAGTPVAAWVTRDYAPVERTTRYGWQLPDGSWYYPCDNLHCVVVAGMADGCYQVADPLDGWQQVDSGTFWASFSAMGSRALIAQE